MAKALLRPGPSETRASGQVHKDLPPSLSAIPLEPEPDLQLHVPQRLRAGRGAEPSVLRRAAALGSSEPSGRYCELTIV